MAANDALVNATPFKVLIATPVLAAPNAPVEPIAPAIVGAAAKPRPPVATVAATMATDFTGFSVTKSSTAPIPSIPVVTTLSIPLPTDSTASKTLSKTLLQKNINTSDEIKI
jgi:hypothetical protein